MQPEGSGEAVLYAAKSTEDKRGSIPTQFADGREFAEREGLAVVGEYADESASAWTGNRGPQLAAALDHAEQVGGSLICQHSDRLARGDGVQARHLVQLVLESKARGIRLRSVQDDSSLDNVLMAAAMGERNAEDSRRKGAAVKAGMARRRERGEYVGHRPYGYRWKRNADDKRVIVPDPAEAAIVRRIFAEYLAGHSQLAITRDLIQDGVPTHRGGEWHQGTVRMILAQPLYAGWLRDGDGDGVLEGIHEPIVDREEWQKVAELRAAKARTHGRGRPTAGRHLFRKGFLRCGVCGGPMIPRTSPNRESDPSETYRCYHRQRDSATCSMPPVRRADVDGAILAYFEQVGLDVEATREQLAAAVERRIAEARALLGTAEKEAHDAEGRLARVKGDYASGGLPLEDWIEFKGELEPQRDAALAEVERLRARLAEVEAGEAVDDVEQEVLDHLARIRAAVAGAVNDAEGVAAVRAALLRLFDGFVLHRGVPERAHVELIGESWIEPIVSARTIEGYEEKMRPVLARKPHEKAESKYADGLTR